MVEVISTTAESATLKQGRARTFAFGSTGALESVNNTPRERTISADQAGRLSQVREAHNPDGHEIFEAAGAGMRTAALHAEGQSLTGNAPKAKAPQPAATFKPEKPGS